MQGNELRALRKAAGMTQGELGEAMGLTLGFIGEMERGEKPIERRTELLAVAITCARSAEKAITAAGRGDAFDPFLAALSRTFPPGSDPRKPTKAQHALARAEDDIIGRRR